MRKLVLLAALVCLFWGAVCPTPSWAAQVTVVKKDGTQISGDLLRQDATSVTLRLSDTNIPIRIQREQIQELRETPTVAQQYRQRRAALKDDDVTGRYDLAKWLYDQRELQLARRELLDLRSISPQDERVKLLLSATEEQLKAAAALAAAQRPTTPDGTPGNATTPAPGPPGNTPAQQGDATASSTGSLPTQRLTPEQISLIRVYEYDSQARPPLRVQVPGEVFDALFTQYRDEPSVAVIIRQPNGPANFRNKPGHEVLEFLFKLKARDLYDKVRVLDDPPALTTFRTRIHQTYVLNYCATNQCHGGSGAASRDFFLFRNNPWEDATAYANFYILHAYKKDDMYRMVDRARPEESLLIQYGLPRRDAKYPHPDKGNWRPHPALTGPASIRTLLVNWIGSELLPEKMLPEGTYPITYALPKVEQPKVQPAATPTTPVTPAGPSNSPSTTTPSPTPAPAAR